MTNKSTAHLTLGVTPHQHANKKCAPEDTMATAALKVCTYVPRALAHASVSHHCSVKSGMTGKRLSFCWSIIITTAPEICFSEGVYCCVHTHDTSTRAGRAEEDGGSFSFTYGEYHTPTEPAGKARLETNAATPGDCTRIGGHSNS